MIFTFYVLMDTFLFSKVYDKVESDGITIYDTMGDVSSDASSYKDDNIEVNIKEYRKYDTNIYVADIVFIGY